MTKQRIELIRRNGLIDVELLAKAIGDGIGIGAFLKQLPNPVTGTVEIVNLIGPHVDEDRSVFVGRELSVGSQNMAYIVAVKELRAQDPSSQGPGRRLRSVPGKAVIFLIQRAAPTCANYKRVSTALVERSLEFSWT